MFHIKKMSSEDFAFGIRITDSMNWNLVEEDFELMTKVEPEGCFVLLQDSTRVGIATTISFDKLGWLGNVIVTESCRKKGGGSFLVQQCLEYLKSKDVKTVGLYAYIDTVPFYRRLGFQCDLEFSVLEGNGFFSSVSANLKKADEQDVQKIIDFDHSHIGESRKKILESTLFNANNLCYVSIEDEQISGYVAAKVYSEMAEVGPLVCPRRHNDTAINLLKTVLNKLTGSKISMCVPRDESSILNLLTNHGFIESFRVARMFSGPSIIKDCVYIAESLERG
jgi:GNAT superfamily N-acetyltransferase